MSVHLFQVEEHIVPCQHIREYPRATADNQEDVLHLAVKQYIPLNNLTPKSGDVTIIGAHANGFPKELYEPLWDEILEHSQKQGFRIRSIWIADVAWQGDSGILNERLLGNDPGWHDHARDLLYLINIKRDQMPRPIVGIGHSFGGNNLTYLSLMHPRLFTTLVLLDPVIMPHQSSSRDEGILLARMSTWRRELWLSKDEAVRSFQKNRLYATWDPRVFDRWLNFGLRKLPTALYPDSSEGDQRVTLKTTKHQELFTFLRPNFEGFETGKFDRKNHADMEPQAALASPFARAEALEVFRRLPNVRPSVLYIFGGDSDMSLLERRKLKIDQTGIGVGGSGGARSGRVKDVVLEGFGHLVAMEAVGQCAHSTAEWIGTEWKRWNADEEDFRNLWAKKALVEKMTIDKKWREVIDAPPGHVKIPATPKL